MNQVILQNNSQPEISYRKWLAQEINVALNDASKHISHEKVMAEVAKYIAKIKA